MDESPLIAINCGFLLLKSPFSDGFPMLFHDQSLHGPARPSVRPRQVTGLRIPPEMANGVAESAWMTFSGWSFEMGQFNH